MGLEEHIKAGAQLTRNTIVLTAPTGSGSVNLGSAFGILEVQSDIPARLRLYDTEESRDLFTERTRPFGLNAESDVSLVADFSMSAAGTYTIAPAVFGFCSSSISPKTFYRLETAEGQPSQSILRITRYLLEDGTVTPSTSSFYTTSNRRVLSIDYSGENISNASGNFGASFRSGSIATIGGNITPRTYMLVSASVANIGHKARFRLYATSSALYNLTEVSRSFTIEPSEAVQLITDVWIDSGSRPIYFTPKIFGANLETMGDDLLVTAESSEKISGKNEIYYILQNSGSTSANIKIDIALYSLED